MERLQAAMTARATLKSWAEGRELVELVRAAHRAGWLDQLRSGATVEKLAAQGVPAERVRSVLELLVAAGVAEAEADTFRLTPAFDALVEGGEGITLSSTLEAVDLASNRIALATEPVVPGFTPAEALVLARDWGVGPTEDARQLYRVIYEALPEFRDRLEQGGPLLDVGSGKGGALLTTLTAFPGLRAVGVESVPEVIEETRRRAENAGVADRVELRAIDARDLKDVSEFAVCYWAQAFFATEARADTLARIFDALRPGGLLLVQEILPQQAEPTVRVRLDLLFHRQQGTDFGRSAEALAEELSAAGFADPRIAATPAGRLVLAKKP
ncbi:SAM-dependent methyltransferase [Amycolatopsis sacchari]|nr:class I SAM-dependent methyltransferase [Amycolatopsis sacchari]